MMNNLSDAFIGKMKAKKGGIAGGRKTLPACHTVKKVFGLVFTILASVPDVTSIPKPVVFTIFVGTKGSINLSHSSPPYQ
jgi:hypothetical protein